MVGSLIYVVSGLGLNFSNRAKVGKANWRQASETLVALLGLTALNSSRLTYTYKSKPLSQILFTPSQSFRAAVLQVPKVALRHASYSPTAVQQSVLNRSSVLS